MTKNHYQAESSCRRRVTTAPLCNFIIEWSAGCTTLPQAVAWPAFTIRIEQPLRLIVARHPMKLKVEFWRRRLLVDVHLATIFVPVPGISACHDAVNAASLAPFSEWLQFEVSQRQLAGAALVSLWLGQPAESLLLRPSCRV